MSKNDDELSAEELDALLRDLEGRASGGGESRGRARAPSGADAGGDDGEDLEAFLRSLDADDESTSGSSARSRTATATAPAPAEDDPWAAQFAELEAADSRSLARKPEAEKAAPAEAKADKKAEKKSRKKGRKKAADTESTEASGENGDVVVVDKPEGEAAAGKQKAGHRRGLRALKWTAFALPSLVLWWIVGAYLAQWVSAGWLVTLVAAAFVFGLPALARRLLHRGRYVYWLVGLSLGLAIALIAPMPRTAATTFAEYGHWPASTLAEITGMAPDGALVRANASVSGFVGTLIHPAADDQRAHRLGTDFPLSQAPIPAPPITPPSEPQAPAPTE